MGRPKKIPEEIKPVIQKPWRVRIDGQTDNFSNRNDAVSYAKKLIDAGVWYIKLDEEK